MEKGRSAFKFLGVFFALASLILLPSLIPSIADAGTTTIGNYVLVSKTRVTRTAYDYVYRAALTNGNVFDLRNVQATVTSNVASTQVIDGSLSFGNVSAGGAVSSSDTFTLRINLTSTFKASDLVWTVTYDLPDLLIQNVTPDSALPGTNVTVTTSGRTDYDPVQLFLGEQEIQITVTPGQFTTFSFLVPDNARSGPLHLGQGNRRSNEVWFSISYVQTISPAPEDMHLDTNGTPVAVNLLLFSMNEGFDTIEEATRIANRVGGSIVGRVPIVAGYQLKLQTSTLDELRYVEQIIKSDPSVKWVLKDFALNSYSDWAGGENGCNTPYQRESNNVVEGVDYYNEKMSPLDAAKIEPVPTNIGILEAGIYGSYDDLAEYKYGTSSSGGINIYSHSISEYIISNISDKATRDRLQKLYWHGSSVVGIIAAEPNNGELNTGKMAGVLRKLVDINGNSTHKGFNITVRSIYDLTHDIIGKTNDLVNNGASVIN